MFCEYLKQTTSKVKERLMIVKLNTSCGIVSIWDNAQVISSF